MALPAPADRAGGLAPGPPLVHREVAANGARFHVEECGQGPLVLALHGFPLFWWTWRELLPALAAAGYRAAAMDLRGYGRSDRPPRGYDPLNLAADVTGVVRSLGERSAALVGHGWGGVLAWTAATVAPDAVTGLVAVASPHPLTVRAAALRGRAPGPALSQAALFQLPRVPERRLTAHHAAAVGRLLARWSATPGWPSPEVEGTYRDAFMAAGVAHAALEYYRWAGRSLLRPDGARYAAAMAAGVHIPVLALLGEADPTLPGSLVTHGARYAHAGLTTTRLPGGHFPQEEAPAALAAAVTGYLGGRQSP